MNGQTLQQEVSKVVQEMSQKCLMGGLPGNVLDKCGIIETADPWTKATGTIEMLCGSPMVADKVRLLTGTDPEETPMPFVAGPGTYLSPNHHQTYDISAGITGVCVVCVGKGLELGLEPEPCPSGPSGSNHLATCGAQSF